MYHKANHHGTRTSPSSTTRSAHDTDESSIGYNASTKQSRLSFAYSVNRLDAKNNNNVRLLESPSATSVLSFTSSIYRSNSNYCGLSLYVIGWICFFILGTFNNFMNVVIICSAKNLSDSFNAANLIGLISWSLTSISFFTKLLNTLYLQHVTHKIRIIFTVFFNLIGIFGLAISLYSDEDSLLHDFILILFYLVILGGTCSFSENVIVGFLKIFPPKLSGAWSSGTGFAGLFGSFFYLLLSSILNIDNKQIYLFIAPSMMFYLIAFVMMNNSKMKRQQKQPNNKTAKQRVVDEDEYDDSGEDCVISYNINCKESLYRKVIRCYKLCFFRSWMIAFIYLFEYVICVGLASISNTNLSSNQQENIYIYLSVCYQIGVFISRSSVSVFNTNKFGTIVILQFANVVIWHIQCSTLLFSKYIGIWCEYILMIYVGLLGGLMYVNVIHNILCDRVQIPNKNDRELCLNIILIHIVFGMFSSSIYTIIIDNTFFNYLVEKSN